MQRDFKNYSKDTKATLLTEQIYYNLSGSHFKTTKQSPYQHLKNKFLLQSIDNYTETDSEQPNIQANNIFYKVAIAMTATGLSHPFRMLYYYGNTISSSNDVLSALKKTIVECSPNLHKKFLENVDRGAKAAGSQGYVISIVKNCEELPPYARLPLAIVCSGVVGAAVASRYETEIMRRGVITELSNMTLPSSRFTFLLAGMYFLRETTFSLAVFTKNDLSPELYWATLLAATFVTSVISKTGILPEGIRDTYKPGIKAPDFREGIFSTFEHMAKGDKYTHPAFKVPFNDPRTFAQLLYNFGSVSCGVNAFIFRGIFLGAFSLSYEFASGRVPPFIDKNIIVPLSNRHASLTNKFKKQDLAESDPCLEIKKSSNFINNGFLFFRNLQASPSFKLKTNNLDEDDQIIQNNGSVGFVENISRMLRNLKMSPLHKLGNSNFVEDKIINQDNGASEEHDSNKLNSKSL